MSLKFKDKKMLKKLKKSGLENVTEQTRSGLTTSKDNAKENPTELKLTRYSAEIKSESSLLSQQGYQKVDAFHFGI